MKNVLLAAPSLKLSEEDLAFFDRNKIMLHRASTGAEAKKLLSKNSFDIVVAELSLDDISGDELCIFTKKQNEQTYVLLASSGKTNELKVCGRCGADAHIQSPMEPENLLHRVSLILKVPRKRATRVLVKVKINSTVKSEPFFSISHNISATGMMLEAEQSLAMGDVVSCSFYLPDSERLNTPCKVVRIDKTTGDNNRYGVEFVDLDSDSRTIIDTFIKQEREAGNFF